MMIKANICSEQNISVLSNNSIFLNPEFIYIPINSSDVILKKSNSTILKGEYITNNKLFFNNFNRTGNEPNNMFVLKGNDNNIGINNNFIRGNNNFKNTNLLESKI